MKEYGHIPATLPPAQTADGGRRNPVTGAAVIPLRENPYRNTAENLCMCGFCINTHSVATRVKKNSLGNNALHTFFFHVQGGSTPFLFTFNPYRHAYVRI